MEHITNVIPSPIINTPNNQIGLYIHVPFCQSKCSYCNFYSIVNKELVSKYIKAVCDEMDKYKPLYSDKKIVTIYFGGGTPTYIRSNGLNTILNHIFKSFNVIPHAEISLEANPNTVSLNMLKQLKFAGFNRISFGAQSAEENELYILGRKHTNREVAQAVFWAREAEFDNISLDLMIGIPKQTPQTLERSLSFVTALNVDHISVYILKLEEGTPLAKAADMLDIPDDDSQADYYLQTIDFFKQKGFNQYEISNFSKDNKKCKHNLIYWNGQQYLGLGASAHSFIEDSRFYYPDNIDEFIENSKKEEIITKISDTGGDLEEYLMLRLRLSEGFNFKKTESKFYLPPNLKSKLIKKANQLKDHGLCYVDDEKIYLTPNGFLLSNYCTSYLLGDYS